MTHRPARTIALAAGLLAIAAMNPSHAGLITTWSYTVDAAFTSATFSAGNGTVTSTFPTGTLAWGVPLAPNTLQSSLNIVNPAPGVVNTFVGGGSPPPAFVAPGGSIIHANNVLATGSASLVTAQLTSTLALVPSPGLAPIVFSISFSETSNTAPCVVVTSPSPCDDIFVLSAGLLDGSFLFDSDGPGGDPAQQYFVNIFPIAAGVLSTLNAATCAAAGAPAGCIGLTTPEGQATTVPFGFTISTLRLSVPEPGSLTLLGLSLIGLGWCARQRGSRPAGLT